MIKLLVTEASNNLDSFSLKHAGIALVKWLKVCPCTLLTEEIAAPVIWKVNLVSYSFSLEYAQLEIKCDALNKPVLSVIQST